MTIPATAIPPAVRRRIRFRALRYSTTLILPALACAAFMAHGAWSWAVPAYAFVVVPLLDLLVPMGRDELASIEQEAALQDPLFDLLLYLIVPLHWTVLVLFLFTVNTPGVKAWEVAGSTFTMGILCGVYGINVAHELGHRRTRWERALARALLLSSLYMHFIIEHNRGHHRRVATKEDPASARFGESVHAFWLRSIPFSFLSAWRIESDRLRKAGHAPYGPRNEMVHALLLQVLLVAAIGLVLGPAVAVAFMTAAAIGILLLETVNYIEHYGLRRRVSQSGVHARVKHVHSWNSDHLMGRLTLFELTRHSDHHWKASKKYQVLQSIRDAPQLPTGYPGMMVLALIPPLFFRVVHPRLLERVSKEEDLVLAA